MTIDDILADTFTSHEYLVPDPDAVFHEIRSDLTASWNRRHHTRLAPILVAALVLTIAGLVALTRSDWGGSTEPAGPVVSQGFVGYSWWITDITLPGRAASIAIPNSPAAFVSFNQNGELDASDGINEPSGRYVVDRGGFRARLGFSIGVGVGGSRARVAAFEAVEALLPSGRYGQVQVQVAGDTLTLTTDGYTIVCRRKAALPSSAHTPTSATSAALGFGVELPPVYLGPVTTRTTIAYDALVLDPPGSAQAKLTPDAAYGAFCDTSFAACSQPVRADVTLAILTTPGTGDIEPDGTVKPTADHALSYVITWHNVQCAQTYGPGRNHPRPTATCDEVDAVNADTGKANAGDDIFEP